MWIRQGLLKLDGGVSGAQEEAKKPAYSAQSASMHMKQALRPRSANDTLLLLWWAVWMEFESHKTVKY